jgi:vacuolar-type H+-ATPase subunit I/STV1
MTLFEITEKLSEVYETLEATGGEVDEQIDAYLNNLVEDRNAKLDAYAALLRNLDAMEEMQIAESKRLRDRATAIAKQSDKLRERLKAHMIVTGDLKIETGRNRFSVVKNGGKIPVLVSDPADLPEGFVREIVTEMPNLDAIREALVAGQEVPGAMLGERGMRLAIK